MPRDTLAWSKTKHTHIRRGCRLEHCAHLPEGKHRAWQLRRRVPLSLLKACAVSTSADSCLILKPDAPPYVKEPYSRQSLEQSGKWQKNSDAKVCPVTGKKFGFFATRRHHCRASGLCYASRRRVTTVYGISTQV